MNPQNPPPQLTYLPPSAPHPHAYCCPSCQANATPQVVSRISTAGWVFFIIFLFICFPIGFLGFTMREEHRVCPICGVDVGAAASRLQQQQETQARLAPPSREPPAIPPIPFRQQRLILGGVVAAILITSLIFLVYSGREEAGPANDNYDQTTAPVVVATPTPSPKPPRAPRKTVKTKPSPSSEPVIISTAPPAEPTASP